MTRNNERHDLQKQVACSHVIMLPSFHVLMCLYSHALMFSCAYTPKLSCSHVLILPCYHVLMFSCSHVLMLLCSGLYQLLTLITLIVANNINHHMQVIFMFVQIKTFQQNHSLFTHIARKNFSTQIPGCKIPTHMSIANFPCRQTFHADIQDQHFTQISIAHSY